MFKNSAGEILLRLADKRHLKKKDLNLMAKNSVYYSLASMSEIKFLFGKPGQTEWVGSLSFIY